MDSAIHWKNHHPLDNSIGFASVYPLDRDLSGGVNHLLNYRGLQVNSFAKTEFSCKKLSKAEKLRPLRRLLRILVPLELRISVMPFLEAELLLSFVLRNKSDFYK